MTFPALTLTDYRQHKGWRFPDAPIVDCVVSSHLPFKHYNIKETIAYIPNRALDLPSQWILDMGNDQYLYLIAYPHPRQHSFTVNAFVAPTPAVAADYTYNIQSATNKDWFDLHAQVNKWELMAARKASSRKARMNKFGDEYGQFLERFWPAQDVDNGIDVTVNSYPAEIESFNPVAKTMTIKGVFDNAVVVPYEPNNNRYAKFGDDVAQQRVKPLASSAAAGKASVTVIPPYPEMYKTARQVITNKFPERYQRQSVFEVQPVGGLTLSLTIGSNNILVNERDVLNGLTELMKYIKDLAIDNEDQLL